MLRILALLSLIATTTAQAQSLETAIKATYLYKLALFIDWPRHVFAAPDSPIVICLVGGDPFGDLIDRTVKGQMVQRHPIRVRRIDTPDGDCHIAFLSQPDMITSLRGAPVLTVTDGATRNKGIVNFVVTNDRVRFEIDNYTATNNRIAISSRLLALAQ